MPDRRNTRGGFLISRISRSMAKKFAALMKEKGISEIGSGEGRLVYLLWRDGPTRQGELAVKAGIDKSTLAITLARMERKDLVVRKCEEKDGRAVTVSLGPDAAAHGEAYARVSTEMGEIFYRGLDDENVQAFETTLERILANLDENEV